MCSVAHAVSSQCVPHLTTIIWDLDSGKNFFFFAGCHYEFNHNPGQEVFNSQVGGAINNFLSEFVLDLESFNL